MALCWSMPLRDTKNAFMRKVMTKVSIMVTNKVSILVSNPTFTTVSDLWMEKGFVDGGDGIW